MQIFWLVVYFFAIVLSTKVGIVLRLSLCFVFALPNLATADNIDAIKEEIAEGDRSIGGFFKEKYEAFDDLLSGLKENKTIKTLTYVLRSEENPIFEKYNHLLGITYGNGIIGGNGLLHLVSGTWSIPTKFFTNGRTSIEIGGLIGDVNSTRGTTGGSVDQCFAGLMHEFVLNFKYLYFTTGVGVYYRSVYHDINNADRIGSRVVVGIKLAIGKSFDRFNVELTYRHFSNGNLTSVNFGYDIIGIELGVKI